MITRYTKEEIEKGRTTNAAEEHDAAHGDACRCKEASKMTPRELLELMMKDLAFWKKEKKEK